MAYDGSLIFDTRVDSSGLVKGLGTLGNTAKRSVGAVTAAIGAAGTALAGLGGAAIKAGISFESAFAGVKKTVNATDAELSALREGILDLAGEMPMTADAIAGIAESAGQLGIQNENILGFTKTMADLGVATNLAGEEAASTLAKFANITGMDQSNFDRLGSTIVALGNSLATTEADIAAMAMRLAGTGKQIGLSEAQILSFAGALSSVGIEAEAGGTAFSKVFRDMQLAVETGNASLANFATVAGMSAAQFKTAFQTDAAGAILAFIDGLGKSEERGMSVVKVLDDLGITEVRMSDALSRASGASALFADALAKGTAAWEENTALTKEAEQRYATMESRIAILRNRVTELGITFYESTNEDVGGAVDLLSEYVGDIQAAFESDGLAGAVDALGDIIGDLAVRLVEAAPDILEAGADLIEKLADSLTDNADVVGAAAADILVLLAETVQKFIPKIIDLAGEIIKGFAKGLGDAVPILKPFTAALELVGSNLKTLTTITVAYIAATKGMEVVSKVSGFLKAASLAAADYARVLATSNNAQLLLTGTVKSTDIVVGALTGKLPLLAAAKALCTKAQLALNAAWKANPVGLIITAVAALAAGMAILSSACNKETEAQKALRTELEADIETLQRNTEAIREGAAAYEERAASIQSGAEAEVALLSRTQELAAELSALADENGQVSNSERARAEYILGELNNALGTEYTMTGRVINQYSELITKINETLQAKKAQIIANSYLDEYEAGLREMTAQEAEATKNAQLLAESRQKIAAAVSEAREAVAKYHSAEAAAAMTDKEVLEFAVGMGFKLSDSTNTVAETYDELAGEMAEAQASLDAYAAVCQKTAEAEAKYSTASMEIQLENYDAVVEGHGRSAEEMRVLAEGSGQERVAAIMGACAEIQAAETGMQQAATEGEKQMWQTKLADAKNFGQALVGAYEKNGGNATEAIARALSGAGETGAQMAAEIIAAINGEPVDLSVLKTSIEAEQKPIEELGADFAAGYAVSICSPGSKTAVQQAAYALVQAALEAIQQKQDSNSPAQETLYLGQDFVAGFENALVAGAFSVAEAAGSLAGSALDAVKQHMPEGMDFTLDATEWEISDEGKRTLAELEMHRDVGLISEKEYYEKLEYWRNGYLKKGTQDWWDYTIEIAEGLEDLGEKERKAAEEAAKNADKARTDAIKKEKSLLKDKLDLGIISEDEYYKELVRMRDTYFEEGSEDWLSYTKELATQQRKVAEEQKKEIEKQKKEIVSLYTEAAEAAGKSIDEVMKLQEGMEKKLQDFTAAPYDSKTIRLLGIGEHGEDREYTETSLHDFAADNAALTAYRDAIAAAKNRGIPAEMLDVLRDMSVEEGTAFAKLLTDASDEEFTSYLASWQENRDLTKEISRELYRDEAAEAAGTLTAALEAAGKEVPEGFFDNGKTAAENFGDGFIEKISTVVTKIKGAFSSQMQGLLPQLSYAGGVPVYGDTNYFNSVVNVSAASPAQQAMLERGTKIVQTLGGNT